MKLFSRFWNLNACNCLRLTRARKPESFFNAAFWTAGKVPRDLSIVRVLVDFAAAPIQNFTSTLTAKIVEKASTTTAQGCVVVVAPPAHPDGKAEIEVCILEIFAAVLRTLVESDVLDSFDIGSRSC